MIFEFSQNPLVHIFAQIIFYYPVLGICLVVILSWCCSIQLSNIVSRSEYHPDYITFVYSLLFLYHNDKNDDGHCRHGHGNMVDGDHDNYRIPSHHPTPPFSTTGNNVDTITVRLVVIIIIAFVVSFRSRTIPTSHCGRRGGTVHVLSKRNDRPRIGPRPRFL